MDPIEERLRGGQRRYSNLAILTALTLRAVFGLPLRQAEGFLGSLLNLMDLDLKAPDHSTLSRRNQDVEVPFLTRAHDGPIHLIVDSTGLKILGSGEWNAHKFKASRKRRDWRKLHIAVDDEGFIVAAKLSRTARMTPPTSRISSTKSILQSSGSRRTEPTTRSRSTIESARPVQRTSRS